MKKQELAKMPIIFLLLLASIPTGCKDDDEGETDSGADSGADTDSDTDMDSGSISDDASLSGLVISAGELSPAFEPATLNYTDNVGLFAQSIAVTPTASDPGATIEVNGAPVASGAESEPIFLDPGENAVSVAVTASSGATQTYAINVIRASDAAAAVYAKASNTDENDSFGWSVAVDGDTLAVGAVAEDSAATGVGGDGDDNSRTDSGAVYVFRRTGSTWSQEAYIKASNTGANDFFGMSVAIDGDTLAVGAVGEDSASTGVGGDEADNGAEYSGAVYVFTRTGSEWSQQAYIKASNTGGDDSFGYSLALDGDTLAVGAYGEDSAATGVNGNENDNSASSSGAVYVFARTGSTWNRQAYIKASNASFGGLFGQSVALDGDMLAVGAIGEDSAAVGIDGDEADEGAGNSGAAYVFTRTGSEWSQQAYIKASNTEALDAFGWSVALDGCTLAVGAVAEGSAATGVGGDEADNGASASGAVYVFELTDSTWSQQAYIKASNTGEGDQFGYSMALDGDALAVGAIYEDSAATGIGGDETDGEMDSGAVYVFTRIESEWSQQAYVKASNSGADDEFGYFVAFDGDTLAGGAYFEDGNATGVGGNQNDNSAESSGAAYIYR